MFATSQYDITIDSDSVIVAPNFDELNSVTQSVLNKFEKDVYRALLKISEWKFIQNTTNSRKLFYNSISEHNVPNSMLLITQHSSYIHRVIFNDILPQVNNLKSVIFVGGSLSEYWLDSNVSVDHLENAFREITHYTQFKGKIMLNVIVLQNSSLIKPYIINSGSKHKLWTIL